MKNGNLATGIYERLKKGILSLEFPPGSTLQERTLAEELGVSRTPVREAVHRLAQEGWLLVNSRKSIQVRSVAAADMREVFQARRLLELNALDLLISSGLSGESGRRMEHMLSHMKESRGTLYSFISADQSFHSLLFSAAGNSRLRGFWNSVSEEMIWLGMLAMNEQRYDDVLAEHGKIVEAVAKGKKRAAKEALRGHLDNTEGILLRKFDALTFE